LRRADPGGARGAPASALWAGRNRCWCAPAAFARASAPRFYGQIPRSHRFAGPPALPASPLRCPGSATRPPRSGGRVAPADSAVYRGPLVQRGARVLPGGVGLNAAV